MNKKNIISAILLLGLTFSSLNCVDASGNSLVQMDIKKSSSDTVNFTMFTTGSSSEPPVVSKKSDNKYVILMPSVSGSQSGKPDLSGIKDLISDIDIKSVNDGADAYTKVTVITKKPLTINTDIQTSGPVTEEQAEYRQLIAKARANAIKTSRLPVGEVKVSQQQKTETVTPKTIITVNKAPQAKTSASVASVIAAKSTTPVTKSTTKSSTVKFKEVSTEELMKKHTPVKPQVNLEPVALKETSAPKVAEKLPTPNETIKKEIDEQLKKSEQKTPDITEIQTSNKDILVPIVSENEKISFFSKVKNKAKKHTPSSLPVGLLITLFPVLGLLFIINVIRNSVQRHNILNQAFVENLNNQPQVPESYDEIIADEDLSWQEKYDRYLDKTDPEKAAANKEKRQARYKFISLPKKDEVDEKREEFERTMVAPSAVRPEVRSSVVPVNKKPIKPKAIVTSVEKIEKLDDRLTMVKEIESVSSPVKSEDKVIHEEMTKSVKLKAFAKGVSLEETSRRKSLNKKAAAMLTDEVEETPTVPLRSSKLSSNVRRLSDANLKVTSVDEKGIEEVRAEQIQEEQSKIEQDYVVTSVDEYLSAIAEVEQPKTIVKPVVAKSVSVPIKKAEKTSVAASLAQVKPSMKYQKPGVLKSVESTNPISRTAERKKSYMDGLIVKSGFNIDEEKGFYVVNVDGTSALVGRVRDEVFVLKKFDENVEKPIQVRQDQQNVFMVKADGYRSLVKVDEEKMGVLVEM